MRHLLNSLFVTLEDSYASLDGENIVVSVGKNEVGRFPLHILESIFLFSYAGASPALMGKCSQNHINLAFLTPRGKFLCRTTGMSSGNVLLRREQYRISDDEEHSCLVARNFIFGKISNSRHVLNRTKRDHEHRIDIDRFTLSSEQLKRMLVDVLATTYLDSLRGLEGAAATIYFNCFDEMILRNKVDFKFESRNRRPPLDRVNALLSFVYTMLGNDCASALEAVGLDAYVGFLHRDRPGRTSLALDMMEELRPCIADRFVLTMINNRMISGDDFERQENGAVWLTIDGRKKVQKEWQNHKQEVIIHPFLKEKIKWGLVPYVQALLLARYIRGDSDGYPPFLWK